MIYLEKKKKQKIIINKELRVRGKGSPGTRAFSEAEREDFPTRVTSHAKVESFPRDCGIAEVFHDGLLADSVICI